MKIALLAATICLAGWTAQAQPTAEPARPAPVSPESASGWTDKPGWFYPRQAVAAAHPLATQAGLDILRAGGSALDAAVAIQAVLGLVEPQSSGIGGGALLVLHDGQSIWTLDGRETAPASAHERMFLQADGRPMPFARAVQSGWSVGVPGAIRMLDMAHARWGRLPWARLFEPAIRLASEGFPVSARLHQLLQEESALKNDPVARSYFWNAQGEPWPVGHVLRNPEYAAVLQQLALEGSRALHEGPVATAIAQAVAREPDGARMTLRDLAEYRALVREPLCTRQATSSRQFRICGMGPPSSGMLTIAQIMGMLSKTRPLDAASPGGPSTVEGMHRYLEASRLAYADRALYIGDPDFVPAPGGDWKHLIAESYLRDRARLITSRAMTDAPAGRPVPGPMALAPMPPQTEYGTSHISVVDARGQTLAMTTTIEAGFGSRRMVSTQPSRPGGFLLNNQLTDFSFVPASESGQKIANRVEPGKRPRSSMSPTLVLDDASGQVWFTGGSPGGGLIIHYTARLLIGWLDGLNPQEAINLPHLGTLGGPVLMEAGRHPPAILEALRERGHVVQEVPMTSGLQAIERRTGGWFGGADPRREGVVLGD